MPPDVTQIAEQLRELEARFFAYRKASAELLSRLRPLLPPEQEAALARAFAYMLEEDEAEGGQAHLVAVEFLAADRSVD